MEAPDASRSSEVYSASEHEAPSTGPKPRADGRKKFTAEQTREMESIFQADTHPPRDVRAELATRFNV